MPIYLNDTVLRHLYIFNRNSPNRNNQIKWAKEYIQFILWLIFIVNLSIIH